VAKFKYLRTTLKIEVAFMKKLTAETELWECLLPFGPESSVLHSLYKNLKIKICKTLILHVIFNWRKTWRQKAFENRMPKKIVWPKREKVTWDWRRLYNEELYGLYCHRLFFGWLNQEGRDVRDMRRVWPRIKFLKWFGEETWRQTITRKSDN